MTRVVYDTNQVFIVKEKVMIKLLEVVRGDDVNKFKESLPTIQKELQGLTDGTIKIDYVIIEEPSGGTYEGVSFVVDCVIKLWMDTKRIYPEMVNDAYNLVGRKIQELGFGEYPFRLKTVSFYFIDGSFLINIMEESLSKNYVNFIRYDAPTIQQILSGEYSLVIPQEELPTFFEGVGDWIKILEKRASVYYTVYKKGTIEGHTYELSDNPDIKVIVRGVKNVKTQKDLTPFIDTKFISIDGIKRSDENYDFSLEQKLIELLIKKMYDKHGVKLFIDDSVRNR
jgi:hypothetical protein